MNGLAVIIAGVMLMGGLAFFVFLVSMIGMVVSSFAKVPFKIHRPYSAKQLKYLNERFEASRSLENTGIGKIGNRAAAVMTFCFVFAALLALIEFLLTRYRDMPSAIF